MLEALKTRKPAFKTAEDGSVSLDILFKEMRWYRFEVSIPFTLKDSSVSSTMADLLLRQARVHDYVKTHPVVTVAPPAASATTATTTASTASITTTVTKATAVPEVAEAEAVAVAVTEVVIAPRKTDAVKAAIDEARRIQPPRGKNAKGISFGKAVKKVSL